MLLIFLSKCKQKYDNHETNLETIVQTKTSKKKKKKRNVEFISVYTEHFK